MTVLMVSSSCSAGLVGHANQLLLDETKLTGVLLDFADAFGLRLFRP